MGMYRIIYNSVRKRRIKQRPYVTNNSIINRKNNTDTKLMCFNRILLNNQFQLKLYKPSIVVRYRGTRQKKMNNGNIIFVKIFHTLEMSNHA